VAGLIDRGRPEAAVRLLDQAARRRIAAPWAARNRLAMALLHLGRPAEARAVWLGAKDPPSPALRSARLAAAALAAIDFPAALDDYRAAVERQPDLGEAWFGLALLHVQLGEADAALAACRNGRKCHLTPAQGAFLGGLERLVSRSP
jgi:tetratricopeptide (TPR) repeat protein